MVSPSEIPTTRPEKSAVATAGSSTTIRTAERKFISLPLLQPEQQLIHCLLASFLHRQGGPVSVEDRVRREHPAILILSRKELSYKFNDGTAVFNTHHVGRDSMRNGAS